MHVFSKPSLPLALGLAALASAGPCDIYASGNTPCVAAHSTTRALYNAYSGILYQVVRGSDGKTADISARSAGGVANAAAQDSFCNGTTCEISIIYDQSGRGNHITRAPPGGAAQGPQPGGYDDLAAANGAPVTLNGQPAYGVWISPGTGYRNDQTNGVATGDQAQGMYAIFDGNHYNDGCCFDYGNAETNNLDTGNGHMEAIYYGDNTFWGSGSGSGPWIMGDLENGLFSGQGAKQNTANPSVTSRMVTAVVKGKPGRWAIRGGNSQSGGLSTYFDGGRPANGYDPMSKEGAILLGIGGDNSIGAQGTFYEGVMTSGYPSDDTENKVQANILAAKYAIASKNSGPTVSIGQGVSFHVTTPGYDTRYIAHDSNNKIITQVPSSSASKSASSFTVRTGLGNSECYSFESKDQPGSFIRHYNFALQLNTDDGTKAMHEDATFCLQSGLTGKGSSIRSWSYPTRFFRHYNNVVYIGQNGGPRGVQDTKNGFNNDATFTIENSLA